MDLSLPEDVVDFGAWAREACSSIGLESVRGVIAGQQTSADAFSVVRSLGLDDFDGLGDDQVTTLCAAVLAREAGRAALPIPIAALLTGRLAGAGQTTVHAVGDVATPEQLVDHAVDFPDPILVQADGQARRSRTLPPASEQRLLAPFASRVDPAEPVRLARGDSWAFHEVFSAFSSIGSLGHILDLGAEHLRVRHQFGKPLRARQALEYRYVDALVAFRGLRELGFYTIWRLMERQGDPVTDALALRVTHLETIRTVLRHIHQIHGAIGFCFEHDLAIQSQYVQFRRYAPHPLAETASLLGRHLDAIPSLHSPAVAVA
jgi:hypothetical protein